MPIETMKEGHKENPFAGKELEEQRMKTIKLTLDRKSEGRNIEINFKGPGSREELEKALSEGKLPSGWEATVSYGKKGKEYAIDAVTLFGNYLKGTKFDKPSASSSYSVSGSEATFGGARAVESQARRGKTSSGAGEVAYGVSKDKPSSGAIGVESSQSRGSTSSGATTVPFSKSRSSTTSGAGEVAYGVSRDKPSSGANAVPFSKSRGSSTSGAASVASSISKPDETFSGARKVDAQLARDAMKQEARYSAARGKTSSGAQEADFGISRDSVKKPRKNAAEDVAESD
jgi:hypothetical protein